MKLRQPEILWGGMGQRVCVYSFTVYGFTSAVRGNRVAGYVVLRNSDFTPILFIDSL